MDLPKDRNGSAVSIGSRVRLLSLSGEWLENLPTNEKEDVLSMVGEVFEIEEIDAHGRPWVSRYWSGEQEGRCHSHSISLDSDEMELVDG